MHPHTQTHMHLHKQHSATTYIYTCIPTCIYTCALTYKNTQKLRWQPIVQVFKRIKYVYSEINFYLMSYSFTLSVKWLSNASEATNGSSITMGKEQNLHRGNEDLVLLMRLLLSLNLKFLKLKLGKKNYPRQQLPTGAQLPGLAWVSVLLWSRRRTSERCIRPAHLATRTQSPCSSWSQEHASMHRPQMPSEPPFWLSLTTELL